ncbi:MAG: glycosyltransferase family 39 protein, partial [Burkholderiaceae bacterium]|nr:glycosyltransferase family 39 protein [Burkholderiaceae bacterium]
MKTQANKRLWAALAALYIVLLLHLVHYLRSSGEKSVSLQALAIAVIGIALGVFVMTVFSARSEPIGKRAGRSKWLSTLALTGGLAALFILGVEMRPEWVYTHLALTLAVTLAAVNYTLLSPPRLSRRLWVSTLIALAVAITFIRLRGLSYYPALHPIDEPWVLGWALSITRSGRLSDWIMVDRDISLNIYYVLVGGWLKLFGIGLWQGRAFSFVLVHVVILLTALAAKNLYGKRAAWFTAAALFTSVIMMSGARLRHDIGLAVSIAAALWLWSEANTRRKSSFHFAAGIALGSGLASHYHAPFFGVALTIAFYGPSFFLGRKNRWCTLKNLVLFGVGGLVTAILIITIQPIPSGGTAAYLQIASLSDLLASVRQHVANISYFSQYEFVLLALGVGAALLRREERDAVVLCAVLLGHLGLAIASPSGLGMYYLLPLTPFYGLLIGSLFDKGGGLKFGKLALPSSSTVAVCTFFIENTRRKPPPLGVGRKARLLLSVLEKSGR